MHCPVASRYNNYITGTFYLGTVFVKLICRKIRGGGVDLPQSSVSEWLSSPAPIVLFAACKCPLPVSLTVLSLTVLFIKNEEK